MNRIASWTSSIVIALLAAACSGLPGHPSGNGGFAPERLDRLKSVIRTDVDRGAIPGAVYLIARDGRVVLHEAVGTQDPATGAPMRTDSIFRIHSMTKPVVSVVTMMFVEEGRLLLNDPVSKHIPELKGLKVGIEKKDPATGRTSLDIVAAEREMTVHDLLRHTSGLTYGIFGKGMVKDLYTTNGVDATDHSNAELIGKLAAVPLMFQPGEVWEYGRSTDVLGHLLERITGQGLDVVLQEKVFGPLTMRDTAFFVEPSKHARIAEPFGRDLQAGAWSFRPVRDKPRYLSGGGGLVSTAADYLRFAQMLLDGGELDGVRLLSRKTVEYMTSDHLGGVRGGPLPGYGFGLGFAVRTGTSQPADIGSTGDYYWGGIGGASFWIDPKERLVAVWMMQSPPTRGYYRRLYRALVYAALVD